MLEKYLCEVDFVDIKFIDYELRWFTKDDFIMYAKEIKEVYKIMNENQKQIYKWYCYANINTTIHQKNKIWDYLNGYADYEECITALEFDGKKHKMKNEE